MLKAIAERLCLTVVNIFFPPLAVFMVTGASMDVIMNCILFLLAVLPSHIHGFYISWTYFFRRRKVSFSCYQKVNLSITVSLMMHSQAKKGRYPGGSKPFIYSEKVINGGLSNQEVRELWEQEHGSEKRSEKRQSSKRRGSQRHRPASRPLGRQSSTQYHGPSHGVQRTGSHHHTTGVARAGSPMSAISHHGGAVHRTSGHANARSQHPPVALHTSSGYGMPRSNSRNRQGNYTGATNSPITPQSARSIWA